MQQQRTSATDRNDYFSPQRCETCGKSLYPAAMNWGKIGADQPYTQWVDTWTRTWGSMYDNWMQAVQNSWGPVLQPQTKTQPAYSHCESCQKEDCNCRCCVGDADLLIQGRVGERRIVPLVIENNTHRERQVELELSDWTSHNPQSPIKVTGMLASPARITMQACSEETVTLVVEVSGNTDTAAANLPANDVNGCQVFYADLRVKGCDIRPVRIAISLLPRDCAPYTIDCRCGCC